MAINWYQDSGDIYMPMQKKEETNNGIVIYELPKSIERFVKGWTYEASDFDTLFNDDGTVTISTLSDSYYLADKPQVDIKYGKFKEGDKDKMFFITLHIFRLVATTGGGGGGGHYYAE